MIIFDLKNRVNGKNILPKHDIEIDEDISWEYMGKAEWFIIPKGVDLFHTGNQDVQAVIYKVRNNKKFPDCFEFLASLMKERRLSIEEEASNIFHPDGRFTSIKANTSMHGSDMPSLEGMSHFSTPCLLILHGKKKNTKSGFNG